MLRSCTFVDEHCLFGTLEVAAARGQKEGVMKIQTWLLEGCCGFDFFSRGSWLPSSLLWIWFSMFLVERRQSTSFPVFSKAAVSQWVGGQKCQLSRQWEKGWTSRLGMNTPHLYSSLPGDILQFTCPPSFFPEEMGRSMQTICEVSTRVIISHCLLLEG